VNEPRRLRLRFCVNDVSPPPGGGDWAPNDTFYPDPRWSDLSPLDLKLDQFLARPVLVAFGQVIGVRDLIKFLANHYGAVHTTPADDDKTRALRDEAWAARMTTPKGQYSGPVYSLLAVARVVLDSLRPLRQKIEQETWHGVLPPHARGLARQRDPTHRDLRPG
jgi:hypothetical protein